MTTTAQATVVDWLQIIRGEFTEMPGLRLSRKQVQRLWGLDGATCDLLLEALVAVNFLKRSRTDEYLRADTGE